MKVCEYVPHKTGAYPSCHWARGRVRPGQVASPSQGHIETNVTNNHARTVKGNIMTQFLKVSIQFNSIQFYLYSAKLQQLSSQGT